ncbi:MAG TPA: hypothetical protein VMR92_02965 [Gemmatimonadales bacterium]|nr:hypothetical protein [Gemmatimonadales bacterium]
MKAVCFAVLVVVAARPVAAQGGWVLGGGIAFVEYRVDAGYGPERFNGPGLELNMARHFGSRVTLGLSGTGAGLQAAASGDLDRRLGEADASARFMVTPVWGVYGGVTWRAISNDAGRQHWVFGRLGAELRPTFSGDRIHAVGRLGFVPFVSVEGLSSASITVDGAVGLEYEHSRVTLGLLYGVERFAFTSAGDVDRVEQLSKLTLRAGLRL